MHGGHEHTDVQQLLQGEAAHVHSQKGEQLQQTEMAESRACVIKTATLLVGVRQNGSTVQYSTAQPNGREGGAGNDARQQAAQTSNKL